MAWLLLKAAMMKTGIFPLLLWMAISIGRAGDWFVSTNGSPSGNGSLTHPWDLQTAYYNAQAGDTVWLRNGTYEPPGNSTNQPWSGSLFYYPGWYIANSGTATSLITIRSYTNEWAAIDGRTLFNSYIRFRDLEFFNSMKGIRHDTNDLGYATDMELPYGDFNSGGHSNQWINCVLHDEEAGPDDAGGSIVRGCILWYIGWNQHQHVWYPMVAEASGNIVAWPLNRTMNNTIASFVCNSNIIFGSGLQTPNAGTNGISYPEVSTDLAPSGNQGSMIGNVIISSAGSMCGSVASGSVLCNNLFCAKGTALIIGLSPNCSVVSNTIYTLNQGGIVAYMNGAVTNTTVDYNSYYATNNNLNNPGVVFLNSAQGYAGFNLGAWRTNTGYDFHSAAAVTSPPDTVRVMINADQPKRCHIAVCNWSLQSNVTVSLAGVLNVGDSYKLYSAQNYLAGPIQTGTYNGTNIVVPMTNLTTAPMIYGRNKNDTGEVEQQPPPMSPQFGAFVLIGQPGIVTGIAAPPSPPQGLTVSSVY